jgi:hypothetical protein
MSDSLYLSLWFPTFDPPALMRHAIAVMQQFPFSQLRPGITYLTLHPVSWSEATTLEQRFHPGVGPEVAAAAAADILHEDFAYTFTAHWDLWTPDLRTGSWFSTPVPVKFIVQGGAFEDQTCEETGHVQVDFGVDTPFLYEDEHPRAEADQRVHANIHKLVEFTIRVERNAGATGRLLWSESEENLAQKLINRLQRVQ